MKLFDEFIAAITGNQEMDFSKKCQEFQKWLNYELNEGNESNIKTNLVYWGKKYFSELSRNQLAFLLVFDNCNRNSYLDSATNNEMKSCLEVFLKDRKIREEFPRFIVNDLKKIENYYPNIRECIGKYVKFLTEFPEFLKELQEENKKNDPVAPGDMAAITDSAKQFLTKVNEILTEPVSFEIESEPAYIKVDRSSLNNIEDVEASTLHKLSFLEMFSTAVSDHKNIVSINDKDIPISGDKTGELTYEQLDKISNILAEAIQNKLKEMDKDYGSNIFDSIGTSIPPRIGVYMPQSALPVISLISIWKAGCAYVPLSQESHTSTARLLEIVKDCGICMVLTHPICLENFFIGSLLYQKNPVSVLSKSKEELLSSKQADNFIVCKPDPNRLAYIIYSSGTTGTPKGIAIKHAGLNAPTIALQKILGIKKESRLGLNSDVAFDPFILDVMSTLGGGGILYIVPASIRRDPQKVGRFYKDNAIKIAVFTPTMLGLLKPQDFPHLEAVISMGEKLPKEVLDKWLHGKPDLTFINGYGPTEASICTSVGVCGKEQWSAGPVINGLKGFVLSPDIQKQFVEENKESPKTIISNNDVNDKLFLLQSPGKEGELFIQGAGVGRYWGELHQQRNKERFFDKIWVKDLKDPLDKIYCLHNVYRTGDLVSCDEQKNLQIIRRIDRDIKLKDGRRYDVEPYEECLLKHEEVAGAEMGSLRDDRLVAVIETKATFIATADSLNKLAKTLSSSIAHCPVAAGILINPKMKTITNSSSTKSNINQLIECNQKDVYWQQKPIDDIPLTSLEEKLAEIWSTILTLEKESLTNQSHFFQLGGNSMHALQLITKLQAEKIIDSELLADEIPNYPTLAALARRLSSKQKRNELILQLQIGKDTELPTFLIPSLTGDGGQDFSLNWVQKWAKDDLPVYTFKTSGLINANLRANSIYEMAKQYTECMPELKNKRSENCILIGYSSGCAIAYEMAIILQKKENIAKLILIDGVSPVLLQRMNAADHAQYLSTMDFSKKVKGYAGCVGNNDIDYDKLKNLPPVSQLDFIFEELLTNTENETQKNKLMVMRSIALSHFSYHPNKYLSKITLLTCHETQRVFVSDLGWPLLNQKDQLVIVDNTKHFDFTSQDNTDAIEHLKKTLTRIETEPLRERIKRYRVENECYVEQKLTCENMSDITVENENIFDKVNGKQAKRILIVGRSGIGKEELSKHLASRWSQGLLWNREFDLVVSISLKNIINSKKEYKNIYDIIHDQNQETDSLGKNLKEFRKYIENNSNKTLYIIDGFHDVSDGLSEDKLGKNRKLIEELLNKDYIIITSQEENLNKAQIKKIDRKLSLNGFKDDDDISKYLDKFFKDNLNRESLKAVIYHNPVIKSLSFIPLYLNVICRVWKNLGESYPCPEERVKHLTTTKILLNILYEFCILSLKHTGDTFYKKLNIEEIVDRPDFSQVIKYLSCIAYGSMSNNDGKIKQQMLDDIYKKLFNSDTEESKIKLLKHLDYFGLVLNSKSGDHLSENLYSFLDPFLHNFFAAYHIASLPPNEIEHVLRDKIDNITYEPVWWHVAGLLKNKDKNKNENSTTFINALLQHGKRDAYYQALLSIRCADECMMSMNSQIEEMINQIRALIDHGNGYFLELVNQYLRMSPNFREHALASNCILSGDPIILEEGPKKLNQCDPYGRTPLFLAAADGWQKSKLVAIKKFVIPGAERSLGTAFNSDAQACLRLQHPNIIRYYGALKRADSYQLIMEFMKNRSLFDVLKKDASLINSKKIDISVDIGEGLHYLHQQKPPIFHQSLTSFNVLLDENYHAKLSGTAFQNFKKEVVLHWRINSGIKREPKMVSALAWKAPETLTFQPKYSAATDVYAYGMVMWEMVTGKIPYEAIGDEAKVMNYVKDKKRESIPNETPSQYKALIKRCWAERQEDRPGVNEILMILKSLER